MSVCFDECVTAVEENLDKILKGQGYPFREVCLYLSGQKGKFLRTKLGVTLAENQNGQINENLINPLTAVELLHLATLVQDDVIDNSAVRRGQKSVQNVFGKSTAIVTGDYLFTQCFSLISESDYKLLPLLSKAISLICKGEMRQNKNRFKSPTPLEYYRIISGKTAALFSLCGVIGAKQITDEENKIRQSARLSHRVGMAFQIADDIKDFTGGHTDKPTENDLPQGVITLPVILGSGDLALGLKLANIKANSYKTSAINLLDKVNPAAVPRFKSLIERI